MAADRALVESQKAKQASDGLYICSRQANCASGWTERLPNHPEWKWTSTKKQENHDRVRIGISNGRQVGRHYKHLEREEA